jgi:hypothetical protein
VSDYGRSDVIWGRVRPYPHQTTVLLQQATRARRRDAGRPDQQLGVYGLKVPHVDGRHFAPAGRRPTARSSRAADPRTKAAAFTIAPA